MVHCRSLEIRKLNIVWLSHDLSETLFQGSVLRGSDKSELLSSLLTLWPPPPPASWDKTDPLSLRPAIPPYTICCPPVARAKESSGIRFSWFRRVMKTELLGLQTVLSYLITIVASQNRGIGILVCLILERKGGNGVSHWVHSLMCYYSKNMEGILFDLNYILKVE